MFAALLPLALGSILGGSSSKKQNQPRASPLEQSTTQNLTSAQPLVGQGFNTLQDILSRNGRIDESLMQRELREIRRGTQAQQQTFMGGAASRGLQNSGALNAINQSIGSAGADREAGRLAQESAMVDERQRNNILLVLQSILNPSLQASAIDAQRTVGLQDSRDRKSGSTTQAFASLLNGLLNIGG